jgi:hypothetical protein
MPEISPDARMFDLEERQIKAHHLAWQLCDHEVSGTADFG